MRLTPITKGGGRKPRLDAARRRQPFALLHPPPGEAHSGSRRDAGPCAGMPGRTARRSMPALSRAFRPLPADGRYRRILACAAAVRMLESLACPAASSPAGSCRPHPADRPVGPAARLAHPARSRGPGRPPRHGQGQTRHGAEAAFLHWAGLQAAAGGLALPPAAEFHLPLERCRRRKGVGRPGRPAKMEVRHDRPSARHPARKAP